MKYIGVDAAVLSENSDALVVALENPLQLSEENNEVFGYAWTGTDEHGLSSS